jgi:hypothetical protein
MSFRARLGPLVGFAGWINLVALTRLHGSSVWLRAAGCERSNSKRLSTLVL